jgi:serine phosphatase RsbU (regulator of sigma subunit)
MMTDAQRHDPPAGGKIVRFEDLKQERQDAAAELNESELRALLMAQLRVTGDLWLTTTAERALDKLVGELSATLRYRATCIRERVYVDTTGWHGKAETLSALPIVQDAVMSDHKLAIWYRRGDQELVERTVDPLGLVAKSGTWYLFARTGEGFRSYRVSRIEEARLLDLPSDRPSNFDLATSWNCSMERYRGEVSQAVEAQRHAQAKSLEMEHRAAQELEIAKEVQAKLFPQTLVPRATLDYAGVCLQARKVGGDYYDYFDLSGERLGLVIGDLAGKGIAAALLMVNLQAHLHNQYAIGIEQPQELLCVVNQLFFENTPPSAYATLLFAEYDGRARVLHFANCGHPPALLLRADGVVEKLTSTGTVLGLFQEWNCAIEKRQLFPGDMFVLYTDGITESCNQLEEEFGEQRLIEALDRYREMPASNLLASVVEEVQQFCFPEQQDDITLIVAKCR